MTIKLGGKDPSDTNQVKESILDSATFGECRTNPTLMIHCIRAFLMEEGFTEDNLPPENVLNKILNTFAATVAVRALLDPATPMRQVIEMWDKVMLNYVAARVSHNPACLAVNAASNEQEMASDIVVASH